MLASLLCAFAVSIPAGDRLLMVETLNCQDWAQLANQYIAYGRERAVAELTERSKRSQGPGAIINPNVRTCLMARLIFEPKGKAPLREPRLGALNLPYMSMPVTNWPLIPFVQRNGVVFLLSESYRMAGKAETCESYLAYCVQTGRFRSAPYKVPTLDQAKETLRELLKTAQWNDLRWTHTSPSVSYSMTPEPVANYLAKQTKPTDFLNSKIDLIQIR
jgi:hypothetical protein